MAEETTPPTAPTRRRSSSSSPENSGGGAKILSAILAIIVGGLAFALYQRNTSGTARSGADAKTISSLSNQVTELRTKLALEHSNLEVAQSNHLSVLSRRTADLMTASNRLVQTALLLDRAREETRLAQMEIPARVAALATVEAQRDELQRQAALIPELQRTVAGLKEKLQQAQFAQAGLEETLGRARASQAELERKLEDPAFLRLQARRAEEAAEMRQRTAAGQRVRVSDPRVRLDLQPDGTIRPAVTARTTPRP